MSLARHRIAGLALAALLMALATFTASAQDVAPGTLRDKVSYMMGQRMGTDLARTLAQLGLQVDLQAVEKAITHGFHPGGALIDYPEQYAMELAMERRLQGQPGEDGPGERLLADPWKVGLYVGGGVGTSLQHLRDELDVPMLMNGLRHRLVDGTSAMSDTDMDAVELAFKEHLQERQANGGW